MTLLAAVPFLKDAVARSLPGGAASQYVFDGGWMYAEKTGVLAAYPVNIQGTFGIAADELEGVIGEMATEPLIESGENGTMMLRSGRLHSSIDVFGALPPEGALLHDMNDPGVAAPADITTTLAKLAPFVAPEGNWQTTIDLRTGFAQAMSNKHLCRFDLPELQLDENIALPREIVGFLAKFGQPSKMHILPTSLGLTWASGAWARCQLSEYRWDSMYADLALPNADCPIEIDDDWREGLAHIIALGDDHVDLNPDGMVGVSVHGMHVVDFDTGVEKRTRWNLKALANVFKVADHWAPDAEGPATFRGKNCRGIVAGMQR